MDDLRWPGRLGTGARQAVGLGLIAGALEVVALASGMRLPLSSLEMGLLGLVDVILLGAVGGLLGAAVGLVVHPLRPDTEAPRALSLQLAGTAVLLCGLYLWQGAWTLMERGQPVGAGAMAVMPLGFGGVVYFNARYWLRRMYLGRAAPVPWLVASGGLALAIVAGAAVLYPMRATGGTYALEGDRNLLLVSIDGLRVDEPLPALDALAADGVRFLDAVSPSPHATPANATLLTGLHPLRHRVILDGDRLSRGLRTLPETLEAEGYATGAFVSSDAVDASTGLDQGFRVFDDDLSPVLPGLRRINLVGHLLRLSPGATRPPEDTGDRFLRWLQQHHAVPFLGWVHLTGPSEEVDRTLGAIREGLATHGVLEDTLVVVTGSHGVMRGEHGVHGARTLHDPAIRVPMVLRMPGVEVQQRIIEPQVRTTDIAASALDWLGLDEPGETEGVSLLGYARGERKATIWCALVGLDADGRVALGMRNNGVKYVRHADGTERLYDLRSDPDEAVDISGEQPTTLDQARQLMISEQIALERLLRQRGL